MNGGGGNAAIIFPNGLTYTPGVQQTLEIVITDSVAKVYGFQMTARLQSNLANGQAGDFTAGAQQLVLYDNGSLKTSRGCPSTALVQFIEHSAPFKSNTMSVLWTPPAANVGNVHIYVAANAANFNGTETGDHTYAAEYVLTPAIGPPPTLSLSQTELNFGISGSSLTSPQTVALTFSAGMGVSWSASSNRSNITVLPSSGSDNGTFAVMATAGPSGVITVTAPGATNSPLQIKVNVETVTQGFPFGSFDTPVNNATGISGAVAVTGWALDNVEVTKVDIWREPVGAEPPASNGLVYIGDAVFVAGARPDVQTVNPSFAFSYRAGWGYLMLTTGLPPTGSASAFGNGTYKIHAIAHNAAGASADLGTKTISVDNADSVKPFGTIDTPDQGATVSGAQFINFGWALAQNPNCIPIDGSTLSVIVDGVMLGRPVYNQNRSDLAAAFHGRCNSTGAAGYFFIDTTKLTNGVHTIGWLAYDNNGNGDGLGSRFFNVLNSGASVAAGPEELAPHSGDVKLLRNRRLETLVRGKDGSYRIEIEQLDRVVLDAGVARGYLFVGGRQQSLPAGSTIRGGAFYWQLAPEFLGDYDFVLERLDGEPVRVLTKVGPKGSPVDVPVNSH